MKKISAAADKLKTILNKVADDVQNAALLVDETMAQNDPPLVETLLEVRVGMTRSDVRLFRSISDIVKSHKRENLKRGFAMETLRLLTMNDDSVRADAIADLSSDDKVADLRRIESYRRWSKLGEQQVQVDTRMATLESMAKRKFVTDLARLEATSEAIVIELSDFIRYFVDIDEEYGPSVRSDRPDYADAFESIRVKASAAKEEYERILGKPGSVLAPPCEENSELITDAYKSLVRLSSGQFAHAGGFALAEGTDAIFSNELVDAISYLCSPKFKAEDRPPLRPDSRLRVLELAAGAGGQAIGLMSAGFNHVALYEVEGIRVKTLQNNWPRWTVRKKDLRDVPDREYATFRGIDLLAGSLAPAVTHKAKTGECKKAGRKRDSLTPEMIRAVKIVEPRAVLLESGKSISGDTRHANDMADVRQALEELGYTAKIVSVSSHIFGLPQEIERTVVVGIRRGEPGVFTSPVPERPVNVYIPEALRQLVIRHETPPHLQHLIEKNSPQQDYDRWAAHWTKHTTHEKRLTTIPSKTDGRDTHLKALFTQGFDGSTIAAEATGIHEPGRNLQFRPNLTVEILARAQGFPDKWGFSAQGTGSMKMIAESFPPKLAKAIGLQIHSALTGIEYDLDAALEEPLIDQTKLGRRPLRLARKSVPENVLQIVRAILLDPEFNENAGDQKRRARILRELIKAAEPNHMRRKAISVEVDREDAMRAFEDEQSFQETRRSFPYGVP